MRLDPRSIPYRAIQGLGQVAALVLFGAVFSAGDPAAGLPLLLGLVIIGVTATVAWQALYHRHFEYELTDDTIDIHSGVISRREREIPYRRIHNVDVAQNAVQRALGIAEVRLETAGGSETEASLQYVSRAEADRLQAEISRLKRDADLPETDEEPAGETLFTIGTRDLAVLGLVSADLRLLTLVAVVGSGFVPALGNALPPGVEFLLTTLGPLVAVFAIAAIWAATALRAFLRYHNFKLTRHGDELRYERGLLQRYNGTIPLEKVQTVAIRENPLARRLGYATLVIETAGYAGGSGATVESAVPIARRNRVLELARALEPVESFDVNRIPRRARYRYVVRYAIAVVVLAGATRALAAVVSLPQWWLVLGLFALLPVAAHLTWIHRGYRVEDEHVITRSGFWRRITTVVRYDRVQTVHSSQT
ncbi:MAG: PH domain-containing protein, partial [Salinirussus sp.]